jgi:hypothetical protein
MLDGEHWRKRADEMRRIADGLGILERARASILRTADEFDQQALKVEERLQAKFSPGHVGGRG